MRSIRSSLAVRSVAAAFSALALAATALVAVAPASTAVGPCGQPGEHYISPGADLRAEIVALCPGDTLKLNPGTYTTGYLRFYAGASYNYTAIHYGGSNAPISITAADPANPPLLRGGLQFADANFWRISYLRVEATQAAQSALYMNGGVGWSVRNCEFFGARNTNSYANVVITGKGGYPRGFEFYGNLVHDAARSNRPDATDHNVYINFQGAPGSGGIVTRNVIWGHPHGAGIKLGNGGAFNALGPWGVTVSFNTIFNGGRQILLHGNVRNNRIFGNILQRATQRFARDPRTTQIYAHDVTGRGNVFTHNYAYQATLFAYDPKRSASFGIGNRSYNDPAHDPVLRSSASGVLVPQNPVAQAYGASGTGRW